jgi:hypothetical protein
MLTLPIYSFVDRDMFMRFHGGGVGHKAMRDWDEFQQGEGHGGEEAEDEGLDSEEDILEMEGSEDDLEDIQADINEEDSSSDEEEEEEEDDALVADDGEELDDDVLAQEGYGAL